MSDHAKDEEYVTELLARLTAARKVRTEAELVAANQASELATIAAALGDQPQPQLMPQPTDQPKPSWQFRGRLSPYRNNMILAAALMLGGLDRK